MERRKIKIKICEMSPQCNIHIYTLMCGKLICVYMFEERTTCKRECETTCTFEHRYDVCPYIYIYIRMTNHKRCCLGEIESVSRVLDLRGAADCHHHPHSTQKKTSTKNTSAVMRSPKNVKHIRLYSVLGMF